ncbi:MAG: ABC-F family ATP-binding cassette domain-containing protein [Anaerolineae bacterium]|nr:ABC-F family ATP-binding cassette domain-containing protein [Anaerolineae bacterium]
MAVLTFYNLGQSFGDVDIFAGLAGEIPNGAKIGLVGPNGIGKTTLLRILVKASEASAGNVFIAKGTRIGYLQQEAVHAFVAPQHSVYEEMLTVFSILREQEIALQQMEAQMAEGDVSDALFWRYGEAQESFELAGGYDYELRIQQVLTGLGFEGDQQHMPLAHCSGGQKTRALLARLLLEKPDLLILDEPTNHLDVIAVEWLEEMLRTWDGAILIVSHDRYFLDRVVDVIWEMSRNGLEMYRGNYSAYLLQREDRWAWREKEFDTVQARFLKDLDFIKRNIIRESTTARAQGLLRRLIRQVKAVEMGGTDMLNQKWLLVTEQVVISKEKWSLAEVESRIKALPPPNPGGSRFRMRLERGQRGGNMIVRAKHLVIGYPGTPLFRVEDIELLRKECAALIGPNGTGKTTFLRTLMEQLAPLSGSLRLGANLDIRYFAQGHEIRDPDHTLLDELWTYQPMPLSQARDYLARYQFRGDDVFKPMRALSGGERGRFALAVMTLQKANFLLLDEPTNHLDIPAQEALEDALLNFDGTILLVSHDRYLIDRLATQIWELRDGRLHVHKGNYTSYLAAREAAGAQPIPAQAHERVVISQRRSRSADRGDPEEVLLHIEARINEMESALLELGQALTFASTAQNWKEVRALDREYKATQTQLDALMVKWESLAQVQA